MNRFEGEFAALQSQRKIDEDLYGNSLPNKLVSGFANICSEFGAPGAGLFARALKGEQPPLSLIVKQIEESAYSEICRIKNISEEKDCKNLKDHQDFEERLQSHEAKIAYMSSVIHGMRTSDPQKHRRIGALTIRAIYNNDLEPESLDDMMRAAVELKMNDVEVLADVYSLYMKHFESSLKDWFEMFCREWNGRGEFSTPQARSALVRLQAFGFVYYRYWEKTTGEMYLPNSEPHLLTEDGKKFYERLQEIAAEK